jgi:hypothetical protein
MPISVFITLTSAGASTGPFNLYSNYDGYISAFETGVSKTALVGGYLSTLVPDGTTTVRVMSAGACTNYVNIAIGGLTTTSSTSSTSSTSTTSTTTAAITYAYYVADIYSCATGLVTGSRTVAVQSPATLVTNKYYRQTGVSTPSEVYKVTGSGSYVAASPIMDPYAFTSQSTACSAI